MSTKDSNPKDAVGTKKWRQYCTVPTTIIWELGVAMLEGARKYGRHNYRVAGVRASVYIDAAKGHIDQWWEGEDIDAESGLSHITKAMASLAVLRDAMINDMVTDDRPPKCNLDRVRDEMQAAVEGIFERFPDAVDPYTELGEQEKNNDWSGVIEEFDLPPLPIGPHTINVNGQDFYMGDATIAQIDVLAKFAGFRMSDSDLYQLEVYMKCPDEQELTLRHGNAFTTHDGTEFSVRRITANDKIDRGLEERSIEERGEEPKPVNESLIDKPDVRIVDDEALNAQDLEDSPFPPYTIVVDGVDHDWHKNMIDMSDLMILASQTDRLKSDFDVVHYDPNTREENIFPGNSGLRLGVGNSSTYHLQERAKTPFIEIVEADRPEDDDDPVLAMERVLKGQGVPV